MVLIEPAANEKTLTVHHINRVISENAKQTALILLPGIQYYTGQLLEIKLITRHAHSKGIVIGWDLAHAVGNVELQLHQWDVDFAVWCTYKYLNSGPGSIAGLFVHEKHGQVDLQALRQGQTGYMHRLSGWWGSEKQSRFEMDNGMQDRTGHTQTALLTLPSIRSHAWGCWISAGQPMRSCGCSPHSLAGDLRRSVDASDRREISRSHRISRTATPARTATREIAAVVDNHAARPEAEGSTAEHSAGARSSCARIEWFGGRWGGRG